MNRLQQTLGLGSKYREIIIAIALFLVFDLGVLVLNFYISTQIAQDAVGVNLAGRQRMLSQRTVKSLLETQNALAQGQDPAPYLKELATSYRLFDGTLTAFVQGGQAVGGDGKPVELARVAEPRGRVILEEALTLWRPYQAALTPLLEEGNTPTPAALAGAVAYASANNLRLLALMNDFTSHLEAMAGARATRLRLIQTGGILLALINFFFILFHFLRKLRGNDAQLEAARRETSEILATVNEGLFLLSRDFTLGRQHSASLTRILRRPDPGGSNFLKLLESIVPHQTLELSRDYIELLFGNRVNENLVTSLNPLNEVEVHFDEGGGNYATRYLEFTFKRVIQDGRIAHLLVTVNDITARVELARQLAEAQERAQNQMDTLVKILHVEPTLLARFLTETRTTLDGINAILRERTRPSRYRGKLERIFTQVHRIKGEAAMLELPSFEAKAHEFEEVLAGLRHQSQVQGRDFLSLAVRLDEFLEHLQSVRDLVDRLGELKTAMSSGETGGWQGLDTLAQRIAARQGKQVRLSLQGLEGLPADLERQEVVREMIVQLVRNAVVHGIEPSAERLSSGKPEIGSLTLTVTGQGNLCQLVFRDDGRGLSPARLRQTAVARGLVSAEEIGGWQDSQVLALIFRSGFSTQGGADTDAGRGVGMGVIKDCIQRLGGRLKVASESGGYCEFRVSFPLNAVMPVRQTG